MPELSLFPAPRQQWEETWCLKLEQAFGRYKAANEEYRMMLEEQNDGQGGGPDVTDALMRARQAESQALAEYTHVLRNFTDVTVRDKVPEEQSGADSNGGDGSGGKRDLNR